MMGEQGNSFRSSFRLIIPSLALATGIILCWHLLQLFFEQRIIIDNTIEHLLLIIIYPIVFLSIASVRFIWNVIPNPWHSRNKATYLTKKRLLVDADGGIARVDKNHLIVYTSKQAHAILSPDSESLVGKNLTQLLSSRGVSKDDFKRLSKMISLQFNYPEYGLNFGDVWFEPELEGKQKRLNLKSLPVYDDKGVINHVAIILKDISADQALLKKLHGEAEQDSLTGLTNRLGFDRYIETFDNIATPNAKNLLCFLDLDKFKYVNDSAGHLAGDELLRQIANIFNESIRSTDKLARIGGDEFAIMLPKCDIEVGKKILQNIINRVSSHRFNWDGKNFVIGVSIGAIEFESGASSNELKRLSELADQACYVSKERGRNQLYVQKANAIIDNAFRERDSWHSMIKDALKNNQFELYVQPIISLKGQDTYQGKNIRKYEIFIRLAYNGKMFLPGSFLSAAERYGLIVDLDRWVVRNTLKKIMYISRVLRDQIRREFTINLSAVTLQDESFADFLIAELKLSGVKSSLLCFEFSESTLISHYTYARKLVTKLATIGCKTSLDDFGSGITSLSYLRDLPINYLKIDGVFIKKVEESRIDVAMIHALNHLCKVMNMETIAEYVETEKIAVILRRLGVDYAQGYYCGKPLSIDRLAAVNNKVRLV